MPGTVPRRLLLLRHAKSAWPEEVHDHERPLAGRGRRDAPVAGHWLRSTGKQPDQAIVSTARRARETWQLAAAELAAQPSVTFDERVYGATAGDLLDLARQAPPGAQSLLIVGHDPAMQDLTLALTDADAEDNAGKLARVRLKFPTAAIAALEFTGSWQKLGPGRARLTAFVTPRELQASGGADVT
jgi:phosphohistidine phosphatase